MVLIPKTTGEGALTETLSSRRVSFSLRQPVSTEKKRSLREFLNSKRRGGEEGTKGKLEIAIEVCRGDHLWGNEDQGNWVSTEESTTTTKGPAVSNPKMMKQVDRWWR